MSKKANEGTKQFKDFHGSTSIFKENIIVPLHVYCFREYSSSSESLFSVFSTCSQTQALLIKMNRYVL